MREFVPNSPFSAGRPTTTSQTAKTVPAGGTADFDRCGDRRGPRWTLVAASLGFAVIQLDVFVVNVAVKPIGTALGAGTAALQWMVGIYMLMFAAFMLTAGALGDRFGARRLYSGGFVVSVAASMACGLAPSMAVLVVARAVQGIAAAVLASCSLAVLNHTFDEDRERTRAFGIWAAGAAKPSKLQHRFKRAATSIGRHAG